MLLEKLESTNYFPFTHGDLIEHSRMQLARLNLLELQRTIRERSNRKLQATKQQNIVTKINLTRVPGLFPQQKLNDCMQLPENPESGELLGITKARNNNHVVYTMNEAVKRQVQNLEIQKQQKCMQIQDFNWLVQAHNELKLSEKQRSDEKKARYAVDLQRQILLEK